MSENAQAGQDSGKQRPGWSFTQWWKAGFTRLITILPVDAEIHPRADPELKENRGKAPGRLDAGSSVWSPFANWQTARLTPEDYERFDAYVVPEHRAGIGLVLGETICIDIDVTNPETARQIKALAWAELGLTPGRIGNPPKVALLYRRKADSVPFRKRSLRITRGGDVHKLEVLATGQQVVVDGIHPKTGRPYLWEGGHPAQMGRDELPELDVDQIDAFLAKVIELVKAHGYGVNVSAREAKDPTGAGRLDPAELRCPDRYYDLFRRTLAAMPNPAELDRDGWIAMGMAIKAAFGADREFDGFEAWEAWCLRWKGGRNTEGEIARAWRGFQPAYVGWRWLMHTMHAAGASELYTHLAQEAFTAAGAPGGGGSSSDDGRPPPDGREQAQAEAAVDAWGIDRSPHWGKLGGPFQGTRERIQRLLADAGAGDPSNPEDETLAVRMGVAWFGQLMWDGAVWRTFSEDTGVWAEVEPAQVELRVVSFVYQWIARYGTDKTRDALRVRLQSPDRTRKRERRLRDVLRLGGEGDDPVELMERAAARLIALHNRTALDWQTGAMRRLWREDCVTGRVGCAVAPGKFDWRAVPRFRSLMEALFGSWPATMEEPPLAWRWVQAWTGYTITGCRPDRSEHHGLAIRGDGACGKTTFLRMLAAIYGSYSAELTLANIARGDAVANNATAPKLRNKRFAFVSEASGPGLYWNDALLKAIISSEPVEGRRLYSDAAPLVSRVVLYLAGNTFPRWRAYDRASSRRFWWVQAAGFPEEQRDVAFGEQLRDEYPMVLRWILDGVELWRDGALAKAELRGGTIVEDLTGNAGDDPVAPAEQRLNPKTALPIFLDTFCTPLSSAQRGLAEAGHAPKIAKKFDLVRADVLHVCFAAWLRHLRMTAGLAMPELGAETDRHVWMTLIGNRAVCGTTERYGVRRVRWAYLQWRPDAVGRLATMVPGLLQALMAEPAEMRGAMGRVPVGTPGVKGELERQLREKLMMEDDEDGGD
jgi:hypothetical protein